MLFKMEQEKLENRGTSGTNHWFCAAFHTENFRDKENLGCVVILTSEKDQHHSR